MRNFLLSLCLSGFPLLSYSQGSYPLEVGNKWEYWDIWGDGYMFKTTATKDTIMENGEHYTILASDMGMGTDYLRQEGPKVFAYSISEKRDFLRCDFSKTVGDTIEVRYYPTDTITTYVRFHGWATLWDRTLSRWTFREVASHAQFYVDREITDSLGLTYLQSEPGLTDSLRGAVINGMVYGTITSVPRPPASLPNSIRLHQNYPNPFNASTVIRFEIQAGPAEIVIYDILGRVVRRLQCTATHSGLHEVWWSGEDDHGIPAASGSYIYRLVSAHQTQVKKMLLVK